MKRNTRRPRQATPARHTAPATPIPPLIAALIRFTDPHVEGLTSGFIAAYAAMPRLISDTVEGREDHRYSLIRDISGLTKAQEAVDQRGADAVLATITTRDDGLLRAMALLAKDDADLLAELTTPLMDATFNVGFAFAAYLLSHGGAR